MTVTDGRVSAVDQMLARFGSMTRQIVFERIPFGPYDNYLYDVMREYPARPAKYLRPALCMATCEAFGSSPEDALLAAAAIEILHNAFLIHDDIADGSYQRRGRPTLHASHGLGIALNAGDGLALLAQRVIREAVEHLDVRLAFRILDEFDAMAARTVEGQALELGWTRDGVSTLTADDYLDLIMRKTCWYTTIHPLRVGALIGSQGAVDVEPMIRFGFYLGAAFQIRDDILNLVGDEAAYGKEIDGDLREGKRTLMLIHLVEVATGSDRDVLHRYLSASPPDRTPEMVADLRRMMRDHGSIEFAASYAEGIASEAANAFDTAFEPAPSGRARDFVRALIPYMLERSR